MKIAILGTRGIPNNYGGFEQFAEHLSVELFKRGHEVTVYCPKFHPLQGDNYKGIALKKIFSPEKTIGAAANFIYDHLCLKDALKNNFDIILECGYASVAFSYYLLNIKKSKIVTNMDGMEWQRSKWGGATKQIIRWAEKLAVKKSHSLVADNIHIQAYFKEKYNTTAHYIPYGADIIIDPQEEFLKKYDLNKNEYSILVARLEPENSIETILDGYLKANSDKKFIVVSNSATNYGKTLIHKYQHHKNIQFIGYISDQVELNSLRHYSEAYFHGHTTGGTNPSLLEAMASKAFIIAHENIYNRSILGDNALYFTDSDDIQNLLSHSKEIDKNRTKSIQNNFAMVEQNFNWSLIADQYEALFKALIE